MTHMNTRRNSSRSSRCCHNPFPYYPLNLTESRMSATENPMASWDGQGEAPTYGVGVVPSRWKSVSLRSWEQRFISMGDPAWAASLAADDGNGTGTDTRNIHRTFVLGDQML